MRMFSHVSKACYDYTQAHVQANGGIESDKALAWENCAEREALSLQIQLVIHLP